MEKRFFLHDCKLKKKIVITCKHAYIIKNIDSKKKLAVVVQRVMRVNKKIQTKIAIEVFILDFKILANPKLVYTN